MRTIKTLAVLMLAAVISAGAFAAAKKVDSGSRILGKTDKNPVSYKVGEEITITLTPVVKNLPEGKYFVRYNLDADHKAAASQKGKVDASKGDIVLKVKMSKPGFVRVVAKLVDENKAAVISFIENADDIGHMSGEGGE